MLGLGNSGRALEIPSNLMHFEAEMAPSKIPYAMGILDGVFFAAKSIRFREIRSAGREFLRPSMGGGENR